MEQNPATQTPEAQPVEQAAPLSDRKPTLFDIGGGEGPQKIEAPVPVAAPVPADGTPVPVPAPTPVAAPTPAPTPVAAPTPEGAVADEDHWADFELDGEGSASTTPLTTDEAVLTQLSEKIGLTTTPASYDELAEAINQKIAAEAQLRSADPIRELTAQKGLSHRELLKAEMWATRPSKYITEASIDRQIDEMEKEGTLQENADQVRAEIDTKIEAITKEYNDRIEQQNQLAQQARSEFRSAVEELRDPFGKPYPDAIKRTGLDFTLSKDFLKTLFDSKPKEILEIALNIHPVIGPKLAAMRAKLNQTKGASDILKEIEVQAPGVGTGMAGTKDSKPTLADVR
ncbi:MAG: hypothetical protein EON58_06790 [Alphaproteobacteria bacterium]|nr:MAG: hypothetical protein EON58_06790 [Alphaproteobacteria bacterium]